MTSVVALSALGFVLGMRHATDPDHVIAVTTIVTRYRGVGRAALVGAAWGIGHTITIVAVGGAIILFGWVIPPRVGLSMELSVGAMLVVLGIASLRGALQRIDETATHAAGPSAGHSHAHTHGEYVHTHPHGHDPERHPHAVDRTPLSRLDRALGGLRLYQLIRPLVVGVVHGLAGSAAVTLLVLAAIQNVYWSVVYLVIFGLGTIAGMMLITAAIGVPFAVTSRDLGRVHRALRLAAGLISIVFGLVLAYQIGFIQGLFTGHARWDPR